MLVSRDIEARPHEGILQIGLVQLPRENIKYTFCLPIIEENWLKITTKKTPQNN